MLVHEIAEELQLEHESVGEGPKRHIVLKKVNGNWEQKWKPVPLTFSAIEVKIYQDMVTF